MTDKEIIFSLECCDNGKCSECSFAFKGGCTLKLRTRALDLINRQQAEIERLESLVKTQGIEIDELNNFANERLDKFTERYDRNLKAEAIKEVAEKLKRKAYRFPCAIGTEYAVPIRVINEMAGDEE